jgi:hypothetical protein
MKAEPPARYAGLEALDLHGLSAFTSPICRVAALPIARRCAAAQQVLAGILGTQVVPELLILSRADWPGRAAMPLYGLTHYDRPHHAIVAPGEPSDLLAPALDLVAQAAPMACAALQRIYGTPTGIDLTAHVDTYVAHDLGHAFHLAHEAWFPRRWLMELFADLCAYTALAATEPAALPALMGLPQALLAVPASAVPHWSLDAFEMYYGGPELAIATYLWYHGRLFALAERLHADLGEAALRRMWAVFVETRVQAADSAELAALLTAVAPYLATALDRWPAIATA